ncbi:hypothetical protein QQ045_029519 [Rhodiola kirilowii]
MAIVVCIKKRDSENGHGARSLQPGVKDTLLAKLRVYKSDLNNLKTEMKKTTTDNSYHSARDDLLESGMADTRMCYKCNKS